MTNEYGDHEQTMYMVLTEWYDDNDNFQVRVHNTCSDPVAAKEWLDISENYWRVNGLGDPDSPRCRPAPKIVSFTYHSKVRD